MNKITKAARKGDYVLMRKSAAQSVLAVKNGNE